MSDGEEDVEVEVGWSPIYVTSVAALTQCVAFYAFFVVQQRRERAAGSHDLYEPRQSVRRHRHRSPPTFPTNWWRESLAISNDELCRCVGLDSYMYLRVLRLGARVTAVGTILSVVLIPAYGTAPIPVSSSGGKLAAAQGFNRWTLARVAPGSGRIAASVATWWLFIAFILYELWEEWTSSYAPRRKAFLARGDDDCSREARYAVRVEQIPDKLQNERAMRKYLERMFPDQVAGVAPCWDVANLQKLWEERQKVLLNLEKAEAFVRAKPGKARPLVKVGGDGKPKRCGGEKVDAIENYESELGRLNAEIDRERAEIDAFLKRDSSDKKNKKLHSKKRRSSASAAIQDGSGNVELISNARRATAASSSDDDVLRSPTADIEQTETAPESDADNHIYPPSIRPSSTAFITFSSFRARQAALQCELSGRSDSTTVYPAVDPGSVIWMNAPVPLSKLRAAQRGFAGFFSVGCVFWAVPVTFVTGLANLNGLLSATGLPIADPNAAWYGLVAGLLPVIFLAVLMAVLLMVIVRVGKKVKKTLPEADTYALHWHMMFQFANLFLILIGGSLFGQLGAIVEDPTSILKVLADALPGASVFFINMILVNSWGQFGLELSMLPKYAVGKILSFVRPEATLTQRQLDDARKPPSVVWAKDVPPVVFMFAITVVYLPITPIVEVFGLFYFAGMNLVWKHQMLHVYAQDAEGGGEATWHLTFVFLMGCLYMSHGIFIVYMGLKKSPVAVALGFVPLGWTIIVHRLLLTNTIRPLRVMSMETAAHIDVSEGEHEKKKKKKASGGHRRHRDADAFCQPVLNPTEDVREQMPYRRAVIEEDEENHPAPAHRVDGNRRAHRRERGQAREEEEEEGVGRSSPTSRLLHHE